MQRPSHAECKGKIFKARTKVADDDWTPASPAKLLPEFAELALLTAEERRAGLLAGLGEIRPEDYAGYRPPQTSYEEPCREAELFAFQWSSSHFKRSMYLKFCFVKETLHRFVSRKPSRKGAYVMNCYRCGEEMKSQIIAQHGEYAGKAYNVQTEGMVCASCGYETLHASQIDSFLTKLADAHRREAKLLTGVQIRTHRNRLGMSQEQFAKYLNVGVASVKRWELGQAQDSSSDELIRLKCSLQRAEQNAAEVLFRQGGEANEYSGGRSFRFEKLAGVVLFFLHRASEAKKTLGPLHINKLCWFADAANYKRHGVTITGARYARLPYGPVLDDYQLIFRELQNRGMVIARGTSKLEPNRSEAQAVLEGTELASLRRTWEKFRSQLHKIVRDSHEERAWKETAHAELISFHLVK